MEKILLVEGSKSFATLLGGRIEAELHLKVFWAGTLAATKEIVRQEGSDFFLGILGLYLADAPNGEIVDYILSLKIPSVVFTGEMKEAVRERVVSKQVLDYFIKDNTSSIDAVLYFIDRLLKNSQVKALVVDDSKSSRMQIHQFLRRCNFTVLEAVDGYQALQSLQDHEDIQLIIVDYEMPGMNGFALVKKIRSRFSRDRVAIIGLSGHGTGDVATGFLKAGANDFLAKPFRDEELFCRVSQNIEIIEKNINFNNLVADKTFRLREAHEQLKSREKRLVTILETALDGIITADHQGIVTGFNPAAEKLFGYLAPEAIGRSVAELLISPDARESHIAALQRLEFSQAKTAIFKRRIEVPAMRKDGSIIDMEMALTADVLDGKAIYTAFMHDITDRKQLLKSLEETLQVAESSNRTKSEFLANMSHEIRTPMNAIIGMTDLVLGTELTEMQRDNLLIVQNASENLLDLLNSILDLSKIEAGKFKLEKIPFDLHGRIGKACETVAIRAYQKRIGFYCQIAPDLPETVVGDPLRLTQVLINLINNAIKFTQTGSVILRVDRVKAEGAVEQEMEGDVIKLCLSVTDTGIGIPGDRLTQIFDRFTQVDGSTTRQYGGTGLGLTICRSIVQMMGGTIQVESTVGQGSVFSFQVPFETGCRVIAQTDVVMEGRGKEQSKLSLAGIRVLVAYANVTGRTILQELLVHAGALVEVVENLAGLQPILHQAHQLGTPVDLLIIDYALLHMVDQLFPGILRREGWKNRLLMTAPPAKSIENTIFAGDFADAVIVSEPIVRFSLLRAVYRALGHISASSPVQRVTKHRFHSLQILVVDDFVNNQKLATNILEQAGHKVVVAGTGQEAWTILQTKTFDVIFMDLQMPQMDGYETTDKIRQADPKQFLNVNIPIIACTAHALETDRQKCLQMGMNGFLRKPYRAPELLDALAAVVSKNAVSAVKKVTPEGKDSVFKTVEGDQAEIEGWRNQFLEAFPGQLLILKNALDGNDYHQLQDTMAWFQNFANRIGAYRVKWQTLRLRSQVELKNREQISVLLGNLEEECHKIEAVLQAGSG